MSIRILRKAAVLVLITVGALAAHGLHNFKQPQQITPLMKTPLQAQLVWKTARIVGFGSANRAQGVRADDGIIVQGPNPETDTYTVLVETELVEVHAMRIEALTLPSLGGNGPGRTPHGNFVVSEVSATVRPQRGGTPVAVKFSRAEADFEQTGFPAAHAIDGNRATGWAIHGQGQWNVNRSLTLTLAKPLKLIGGSHWTITLDQQFGSFHTLGRFRIVFGAPADTIPKPPPPPPLWGYADLHTHPTSHLAFGADSAGNGGIFWGKPGTNWEIATALLPIDMPSCPSDSHTGFDADAVRKGTRRAIIEKLDNLTECSHSSSGFPAYQTWPSSHSLTHQQMHITSIRRAYDGGLRLMVASITDNQMLSMLWTKINFNWERRLPKPEANFDYESAKRQIQFVNGLAATNPSWMRVVRSAAEARQTIKENKLAIVLGVEMDRLTVDQTLDLIRNHGVRQVIPIHLTENEFGSPAIYNGFFNVTNWWLTGSYYKVTGDQFLKFRLGRPDELSVSSSTGAVTPSPMSDSNYEALCTSDKDLCYETMTQGHKSKGGLVSNDRIEKLMKEGVLIDVAHMGERSTEGTLTLAERYKYPLMVSHTGLRDAQERGRSERDLMRSHAKWIGQLGGVIGHGTEATIPEVVLLETTGLIRFAGGNGLHRWNFSTPIRTVRSIHSLRIVFTTGGTSLLGGNTNADVRVHLRNGRELPFFNVNKNSSWPTNSMRSVTLFLPTGTRLGDITGVSLSGDKWDLDALRIAAIETAAADTAGKFLEDVRQAMEVMDNKPVAFGSDINGFATQIPYAAQSITYPIRVASRYGARSPGSFPPALPKSTLGGRTFDFQTDGLAHFGMLPDLLEAMSKKPNSTSVMNGLFQSADAVVKMWELAEAARSRVP